MADPAIVRDVQQYLNNKTGADLNVDGKMGPGTQREIDRYAKIHRLPAGMEADDPRLLRTIEREAERDNVRVGNAISGALNFVAPGATRAVDGAARAVGIDGRQVREGLGGAADQIGRDAGKVWEEVEKGVVGRFLGGIFGGSDAKSSDPSSAGVPNKPVDPNAIQWDKGGS